MVTNLDRNGGCANCMATFTIIWRVLKIPAVYKTLLFFLVRGLVVPNLDDNQYYYAMKVSKIKQSEYDMLILAQ